MKDFLTDAEMAELEKKHAPDFISDEDMAKHEASDKLVNSPDEPWETGLDTHLDTLSGGYGPQLKAALDVMTDPNTNFANRRDAYRQLLEQGQAANPKAKVAGIATGIAGQMAGLHGATGALPLADLHPVQRGAIQSLMNLALQAGQNPGDEQGKVGVDMGAQLQQINPMEHPVADALATVPMVGPLASKLVSPEMAATKAFSMTPKEGQQAVSVNGMASKDPAELGKFALEQKGLIQPMTSGHSLYERMAARTKEIGAKLGSVVRTVEPKINDWLSKNAGSSEAQAFLDDSFHLDNSRQKVLNIIDDLHDSDAPKMKAAVQEWFDYWKDRVARGSSEGASNPDFDTLQKMRTDAQSKLNYERSPQNMQKTPGREAGMSAILDEVDRSIDHELNLAETLGGPRVGEMKALRQQYSLAKTLEQRSLRQAGKEVAKPMSVDPLDMVKHSMIMGPRTYQAGAAMLNGSLPPAIGASPTLVGMGLNKPEPTVEGFPLNSTQDVPPMMYQQAKDSIEKSNMPLSQKAKRLNLLNLHGKVFMGQ